MMCVLYIVLFNSMQKALALWSLTGTDVIKSLHKFSSGSYPEHETWWQLKEPHSA